jgi:hypothetical protein
MTVGADDKAGRESASASQAPRQPVRSNSSKSEGGSGGGSGGAGGGTHESKTLTVLLAVKEICQRRKIRIVTAETISGGYLARLLFQHLAGSFDRGIVANR